MSIYDILTMIFFIAAAIVPIIITVMNIIRIRKKKVSFIFEIISFITGMALVALVYGLLEPTNYKYALNAEVGPAFHEAFSCYHLTTLVVLLLVGILTYFILKFYKKGFPPILEAILISGVLVGSVISGIVIIQLSAAFGADLITAVFILYIYLFFFNYFLLVINLLIKITKEKAATQTKIEYKNAFLQVCSRFLVKGSNMIIGAVVLMLPLLFILILLLTLFGQQPDSIIKVFTQTSDWLLSSKISPPALESGGHYLCTVALKGHKKIVKPLRYGIRSGKRIVVNRQLCVANAFEQLIMERLPHFHRRVRSFYDNYGYPVSKLIHKSWAADLVYILMKPLEWVFLLVLYTFDRKPEDRIAKQYLPKII